VGPKVGEGVGTGDGEGVGVGVGQTFSSIIFVGPPLKRNGYFLRF